MRINQKEKELIKNAISIAESKTSAEIVPIIFSSSDDYPAANLRLAILMSFLFSIVTYNYYNYDDSIILIASMIPGFLFGYFLAKVSYLNRLLLTKSEMRVEVNQRAIEMFYKLNISNTINRNGILIYISLLERRVELIADIGLTSKLDKDFFDKKINLLTSDINTSNVIDGLINLVNSISIDLEAIYPSTNESDNELENDLVTDC